MTKTKVRSGVEKFDIPAENAAQFKMWFETRGGLAIWGSLDLGNPGQTYTTPRLNKDGVQPDKPHWGATTEPIRIITDISEVEVVTGKEVKRFKVKTRMGSQGLSIKLSDDSSRRLKEAVAKAGKGAWSEFDYKNQQAIIYVPGSRVPLSDWKA